MMNVETKRHIDAARQVLVGAVPNPISQIDQVTNALIYKFMDDMDQDAMSVGGNPSFFIDELEPYSWTKLMDSRMGNHERMERYSEALGKFSKSKQLPELFRSIFKSAFLPYRSPDTLGLFLKEIDYFSYSHPEELGNAYEYLLSLMASQGDAGQFRTPRHIIDFMVDVMNPTKDDKVLDPACGTGGFLVSSYQHILKQHDGKKNNALTSGDRKKLMKNFEGYDIDPTMVRIAQVNMYLHQIKNPLIHNYDTLSSDDRWNDKYDVVLANPPFMSPKGGIRPHAKFSIKPSRSEVLFVDYIMNHLRPKGRAAIIVPDGILFRADAGYKQLRKNLLENGLYAVVSLPSGVFQPYAGVKTSILLIDNDLTKKTDEVLFLKVENDGFGLGAQRKPIDKNGLPQALNILNEWKQNNKVEDSLVFYVEKSKIAETEDYKLSRDHYRTVPDYVSAKWPMVELGEVCTVLAGNSAPQDEKLFENGRYPFFRTSDIGAIHLSGDLREVKDYLNEDGIKKMRLFPKGTVLFPKSGASTFLNHRVVMGCDGYISSHLAGIYPNKDLVSSEFVYYQLRKIDARQLTSDQNYPSLRIGEIKQIKIPLPPLEVQEQIVAELDGYSKIISGARKIVENWKPKIDIDPSWEKVKLGDACILIQRGKTPRYGASQTQIIKSGQARGYYEFDFSKKYFATEDFCLDHRVLQSGDLLLNSTGVGTAGRITFFDLEGTFLVDGHITILRFNKDLFESKYALFALDTFYGFKGLENLARGSGGQIELGLSQIRGLTIPLPPLEIQKQIVEKIEAERALVKSSKKLISIYEEKIKKAVEKLWTD